MICRQIFDSSRLNNAIWLLDSTALWDIINNETTAAICDNGFILHESSYSEKNVFPSLRATYRCSGTHGSRKRKRMRYRFCSRHLFREQIVTLTIANVYANIKSNRSFRVLLCRFHKWPLCYYLIMTQCPALALPSRNKMSIFCMAARSRWMVRCTTDISCADIKGLSFIRFTISFCLSVSWTADTTYDIIGDIT